MLRIVSRTACLRTSLVVSQSSWSVVLDIRWVLFLAQQHSLTLSTVCRRAVNQMARHKEVVNGITEFPWQIC